MCKTETLVNNSEQIITKKRVKKKYIYTNYFQPWNLYQKGKDTTVLAISNRKIYPNGNDTNVDTQKCKTDINKSSF